MSPPFGVFIGYDEREARAAEVCARSLRRATRGEIEPEFLCAAKLQDQGLLWRPQDQRGGRDYDLTSNEFTSTRFKNTRFLTPIICQTGFKLFVDCDTLFLRDPREMLRDVMALHAVSVVKHAYTPAESVKMMGQAQASYPRKNWSSVMLFNCDHAANRRLSLRDVNDRRARDLHQFYWLADAEIGALDPSWNWLANVTGRPIFPGIAHFTLGGPWLPDWPGAAHDDLWLSFSG